jgi:ribosomal protein S18 acetylase RimI-like enzyme
LSHPLDRPVWNALSTRQQHLGDISGDGLARCFLPDVSAFGSVRDHSDAARKALGDLIPAGGDLSLLEAGPPQAPQGIAETQAICVQMMLPALAAAGRERTFSVTPLGERDAAEMLDLATLTRPGPFRTDTWRMGRFIGIRIDGRLAAMCGERLQPEGFTELSGLCTHPDFRGQGMGEFLLRTVAERALAGGETPFLHAYATNAGAIGLYRRMGFEFRAEVTHAVWRRQP